MLKSLGINKNYEKIVSFVGKLTNFKGIDILLKACKIYEDPAVFTQRCDARLEECNNIMKLLLQAWPKEQHLVYKSAKDESSIIPVLRSILYENFLEQSKLDEMFR